MDENAIINAIPTLSQAKAKRTAKRSKLTRLTRKIDEFCLESLQDQQMFTITKLTEEFQKERSYHSALQNKCDQFLSEKEGVSEEHLTREMELGDEADEAYAETLHRAEKAQLELSYFIEAQGLQRDFDSLPDTSCSEEFEKDCTKLLKQFSSYLAQVSSYNHPDIRQIHTRFVECEADVTTRLNDSRGAQKRHKEELRARSPSPLEKPQPTGVSNLRLELPDFSGHPVDWHHFCFLLRAMCSTEAQQLVKSYSTS